MVTLATGSLITTPNGQNSTRTAISPQIIVRVNGVAVGAIQSINIKESRPFKPIDELGTDGHIDSAPTGSTNITGSCTRLRYDRLRATEAFSRGFIHVASQRLPFDIEISDRWNGDGESSIVTIIENVWITDSSYTYSADNWLITDDIQFMAESISSVTSGGTNAANGGARGIVWQTDTDGIERETDRGIRRGAFDVPGLINSLFG